VTRNLLSVLKILVVLNRGNFTFFFPWRRRFWNSSPQRGRIGDFPASSICPQCYFNHTFKLSAGTAGKTLPSYQKGKPQAYNPHNLNVNSSI